MNSRREMKAGPAAAFDDSAAVAAASLRVGCQLIAWGASSQRVIDSMRACAFGRELKPMVAYDAVGLTTGEGARAATLIESLPAAPGVDIAALTRISRAVESAGQAGANPASLNADLDRIAAHPPEWPFVVKGLAVGVAGAMYGPLNSGDPASWGLGFVAGLAIFFLRAALLGRGFNIFAATTCAALAGTALAAAGILAGLTHTPGIALVGALLFLIPGVPIINGGVDIVRNHCGAGVARLAYSAAMLVAVFGTAAVFVPVLGPAGLVGSAWEPPGALSAWLPVLAGAVLAAALAVANNAPGRAVALCAVGGGLARAIRWAGLDLAGIDPVSAALVAAAGSTIFVNLLAERMRLPGVILAVICVLPMIPGFLFIDGAVQLFDFAVRSGRASAGVPGAAALLQAGGIVAALVVGVIGPVILLEPRSKRV